MRHDLNTTHWSRIKLQDLLDRAGDLRDRQSHRRVVFPAGSAQQAGERIVYAIGIEDFSRRDRPVADARARDSGSINLHLSAQFT